MKKLTFEQHVVIGQQLKEAHRLIMAATLTILNNTPKSSHLSRFARKLNDRIGELRCVMDSQIGQDYPEKDNKTLNHVYYGAG